jgi:hypothetical protein
MSPAALRAEQVGCALLEGMTGVRSTYGVWHTVVGVYRLYKRVSFHVVDVAGNDERKEIEGASKSVKDGRLRQRKDRVSYRKRCRAGREAT